MTGVIDHVLKATPVRPQQQAADMRTRATTNQRWNKRRTQIPTTATGGQVSGKERAQRKLAAQASAAKRRRTGRPVQSGKMAKKIKLMGMVKRKMDNGEPIIAPADLYERAVKRAHDNKDMKVSEKNGSASITLPDGRVMKLKMTEDPIRPEPSA